MFFKRKKNSIKAPIGGRLINLVSVHDQTFSQGLVGQGFAIIPKGNIIVSPIKGKVVMLFPTLHALGINDGIRNYLIHIGIDSFKLKGEGFKAFVKTGDKINVGDKLIEFDLELFKQNHIVSEVIIVSEDILNPIKVEEKNIVSLEEISFG